MADVDELLIGAESLVPVPRDVSDRLLEDLVARLTEVEPSEAAPLLATVVPPTTIRGDAPAAARRRHRRRWAASAVAAAAAVGLLAALTGPGGRATLDVVDPPDAAPSSPAPSIVVPTRSPFVAPPGLTATVSPPGRGPAPVDVPPGPKHDPVDHGGRPGAPAPTRKPGAAGPTYTPVYAAFSDPEGDANRVPVSNHPARAGSDPAADIVEVALTHRTADTFGFRVELSGRPSKDVVYYLVSFVVDGCTFYWTTRIERYSVSRVWCDNGNGSRDRLYEIYGDPIVTENSVGGEFSRAVLPPSIRGMVIPRLQGDTCYVEEPVYRPDQCSNNQTLADMALSPQGWRYVM